jgi:hypothetical protein
MNTLEKLQYLECLKATIPENAAWLHEAVNSVVEEIKSSGDSQSFSQIQENGENPRKSPYFDAIQ